MKAVLLAWAVVVLVAVLLALWWGYTTRPKLHSTTAPNASPSTQPCPDCGHIPYHEAPACDTCGGTGFITPTEETRND